MARGFPAYISLGSNLGDRAAYLARARAEVERSPGVRVTAASSLYETEPVGFREQGWFLNQVIAVETLLAPTELLGRLQEIENLLGRVRTLRWGPRVIDLDLLLYGRLVVATPELILPHPRMYERGFVLIPLCEIAPDLVHPDGKTTREHLEEYRARGFKDVVRLYQG